MNKIILILVLFLCTGTMFGQNVFKKRLDAQAGINVTGIIKLNSDTITSTRVQHWNNALSDTVSLSSLVPLFADSTVKYVTPKSMATYVTAHPSAGSVIGFASYDSIASDSAYFNVSTHKLRVRHKGWWYGFNPSDSIKIYTATA